MSSNEKDKDKILGGDLICPYLFSERVNRCKTIYCAWFVPSEDACSMKVIAGALHPSTTYIFSSKEEVK